MRHPDWEPRLAEVLARWRHNTYSLATGNCLLFAREVILAVTDQDPLDALGVTLAGVSTPVGAQRLLLAHGGVAGILTAAIGRPLPRLHAQRGDLAGVPGVDDLSIGVVDGDRVHVIRHDSGMEWRPLRAARCAWRLG